MKHITIFVAALLGAVCDWLLEIALIMQVSTEYSHLSDDVVMKAQQPLVKFFNETFEDCDLDGSLIVRCVNALIGPWPYQP